MKKNAHCSYCGHVYAADQAWPRKCSSCGNITWINPIPVAVCLLPVDGGLLCVRRAISPGEGKLGLPGGYIDLNETWQQAIVRELNEETGITIDASEIEHFSTRSSTLGDGVILIFGRARARTWAELEPAIRIDKEEVSELVIARGPDGFAFPLVTQVVGEYFSASAEVTP
jgi:ADP-ribose pyrophosphatase YjhB (NUDIX family)